MEFLQIIRRVDARRRRLDQTLLGRSLTPRLDRGKIGEEIDCAAQGGGGTAQPVSRRRVPPSLDIAPILLEQGEQVGEDATAVRYRPAL
jgi:hypothetical protein